MFAMHDRLPAGARCLCGAPVGRVAVMPFAHAGVDGPQVAVCSGTCLSELRPVERALSEDVAVRARLDAKDAEIAAANLRAEEAERRAEAEVGKLAAAQDMFTNQAARTQSDEQEIVARNKRIADQEKALDELREENERLEAELAEQRALLSVPAAPAPKTRRRAAA